jgi:maltooligosyltrehalose trehalohydrolase
VNDRPPGRSTAGGLLFSRRLGERYSLVALNFSDHDQAVPFTFPVSGEYREELHRLDGLHGVVDSAARLMTIPSNYGRIWTTGA